MKIKKIFLLLIIVVLFLPLLSALQLSETSLNVNITKDDILNKVITITNEKSYDVYNIIVESNYASINPINKLEAGKSINITLSISSTSAGEFDETIKFIGFTKINCSEISSKTHNIDLKTADYSTKYLCVDDNIRFNNKFGFPISLKIYYDNGNIFDDVSISTNGSHITSSFPAGVFRFEDSYGVLFSGEIEVNEESKLLHSMADDANLDLHLISRYINTELIVDVPITDFTVSFNDSASGYFTIKNIGQETANNVVISGEWFSFDKNNFNIEPGSIAAVNFIIYPYVTNTNQTSKTYNKIITISSDNSPQVTRDISIYIPYANILYGNESLAEYWKEKKRFCDAYSTSPLCISEPVVIYREKPVYHCKSTLQNMSPETVQKFIEDQLSKEEMFTVLSNLIKQYTNNVNSSVSSLDAKMVTITEDISSTKKFINSIKDFNFFIFGLFFVIIIFGVGGVFLYRLYKRKRIRISQTF